MKEITKYKKQDFIDKLLLDLMESLEESDIIRLGLKDDNIRLKIEEAFEQAIKDYDEWIFYNLRDKFFKID